MSLSYEKPFYAVVSANGQLLDEDTNYEEAVLRAEHSSPTGLVMEDASVLASNVHANDSATVEPPDGTDAAMRAGRFSPVAMDEVVAMEFSDAVDRVFAVFDDVYADMLKRVPSMMAPGYKGGIAARAHRSWVTDPLEMLRENQKTKKVLSGAAFAYGSRGLNLVPHSTAFQPPFPRDRKGNVAVDFMRNAPSLCSFSTLECRATCLVFTGQRKLETGAYARSYLEAAGLLHEPVAFLRVLLEHCVTAFSRPEPGSRRFLRMNVLSDIPWEALCPEFIAVACETARRNLGIRNWKPSHGTMFYDYTKVPGRTPEPEYYDLTYSYTGLRSRHHHYEDALASGRRVAAVFIPREDDGTYPAGGGSSLQKKHKGDRWYPWTFDGMPVWNGDATDIRPLDPENVQMVGLTYKPAHYKVAAAVGSGKKFRTFPVVPEHELDKRMANFLVRVVQPDPDAPPVVCATQDPARNRALLPVVD